jgi:carboxyl-terminal processing protease
LSLIFNSYFKKKKLMYKAIVLLSGMFLASYAPPGDGWDAQQKLLVKLGQVVESVHYSPRTIDDAFSGVLWEKYLETIDPHRVYFLQSDLDALKKYRASLDDEIHGATPIAFVPAVMQILRPRLEEARAQYHELAQVPFRFDTKETVLADGNSTAVFPLDAAAQREARRKRLKYLALQVFVTLQEQRAQSQVGTPLHSRTDAELEAEARKKIAGRVDRELTRVMNADKDDSRMCGTYAEVIMRLMDPHSDYFPPVEALGFSNMMSNRYFGIGVQLKDEGDRISVDEVVPGGPAARSGQVQPGDRITQVGEGLTGEMTDVSDQTQSEMIALLRGDQGAPVRVTFVHADGTLATVSLVRDEIAQDATSARGAVIRNGNKKIGYIFLPLFYDSSQPDGPHCADDIAAILTALKAQQVDGIVFDLRQNGGGSLAQVIKMVALFVNGGPAVQVRRRDADPVAAGDENTRQIYDGPLAIMVNEHSASASEIFTGAIQDYHRGIIIGSTSTYGKGTVQTQFPVGDKANGVLKMTFEQFYRVSGASTQLKGVTPDIILPDVSEFQKIREKDNPGALPWDMVAAADYTPWSGHLDIALLQKQETTRLEKDSAFAILRRNAVWLGAHQGQDIRIDLAGYTAARKQSEQVIARDNQVSKLPASRQLTVELAQPSSQGDPGFYAKWLTGIRSDIYIDQACQIMGDMAGK